MPPATSQKRKLPFGGLQRRVRARKEEPEPELEEFSDGDSQAEGDSEEEGSDNMSERGSEASDQSESGSGSEDGDEDDEDEEDPTELVAQVSFGALAKAQASMPNLKKKKGRRGSTSANDDDDDDEEEDGTTRHPRRGEYDDNKPQHDGKPSSKPKPPKRSSKHAPTEISSKRQVSRRREVIAAHVVPSRDPRFSSATSHTANPTDEVRLRKAYSFLDEYRDSEMSALKLAIKKCRDGREKEELTRQLKSMQSKKEAQARKDAERELIERHRRREKELVAQGKKARPFYLKKAEQKKQLLVDRFAGMKKRDVQKTIERRRKKLTSKEKKNMPFARREAAE